MSLEGLEPPTKCLKGTCSTFELQARRRCHFKRVGSPRQAPIYARKKQQGRPVSRVLFPLLGGDHLSRAALADCLKQSTRRSNGTGRPLRLLDLAPGGVCPATPVTRDAGALLPHLFTLTHSHGQSVLCCTFPASYLVRRLTGTVPYGARTFLVTFATRSPGQPHCFTLSVPEKDYF